MPEPLSGTGRAEKAITRAVTSKVEIASSEVVTGDLSNTLKSLIERRCLIQSSSAWLVSPKGKDTRWLFDLRSLLLDQEALDTVCSLFWHLYRSKMPFQLAGLEVTAVPLVAGLIMKAKQLGIKVDGFFVRKERKSYGLGKRVEGNISDAPVVIVDDLFNSGASIERVRDVVQEAGQKVAFVVAIVGFQSPRGRDWAEKHGIAVETFYNLSDFGLAFGPDSQPESKCDFDTVWTFTSPKANFFHVVPKSAPVIHRDKVIFGSDCGTLWARSASNGSACWSFQVTDPQRKGIWSRPLVSRERVYFGGYDGNLYCLSVDNGREIWRASCADWIGSSPVISERDGILWIGLEHARPGKHGSIAAFNVFSGEKVWEEYLPEYVHSAPAFNPTKGKLAVGTNDRCIYMFDAFSGQLKWRFQTEGPIKEAVTFDQERDLVYAAGFDGRIRALDIETGKQVWALSTGNQIYSSPLLFKDKLFVTGHDKNLHIIDLHNNDVKVIYVGSKISCTPIVVGGNIIFGSNSGTVFELDPDKCQIIGQASLADPITSRLAHSPNQDVIFAYTYVNQLYCLKRRLL